jgi:hypothetical protein
LHSKDIKTVLRPPYSPDIAPCDFYLCPQVKKEINERRFETEIDAVKALEAILKRLSKNGFQQVFEQWQQWEKVLRFERSIQGDFESCADILITSYWLHVELGKNV